MDTLVMRNRKDHQTSPGVGDLPGHTFSGRSTNPRHTARTRTHHRSAPARKSRGSVERQPTVALAQRIKEPPPETASGMPCSIGALLTSLPKGEVAALNAMLYELRWNATQVYEALRDEGLTVGRQSVNRHRGKKCRCFKGQS